MMLQFAVVAKFIGIYTAFYWVEHINIIVVLLLLLYLLLLLWLLSHRTLCLVNSWDIADTCQVTDTFNLVFKVRVG
jgi:hypothetical protein